LSCDLSEKSIADFKVFEGAIRNKDLHDKFVSMQDIYIFDNSDIISFHDVAASLLAIRDNLLCECLEI